ncbi:hypothetical protein [Arthrobacter sp. B6]|uniref:hypothetical protein n=1 Tax=Arthrobacter sp. B6 TaxID=1570137 RepID=UPI000A4F2ABE|nr:hypothetical protein [Arthrobacter sp. B6]
MTIAHHPFLGGLGVRHHAARTPKIQHLDWGHATKLEPSSPERQGSLTSYPWEGLYLEIEETTVSAGAAAPQHNAPLELFLTSLMYGE